MKFYIINIRSCRKLSTMESSYIKVVDFHIYLDICIIFMLEYFGLGKYSPNLLFVFILRIYL